MTNEQKVEKLKAGIKQLRHDAKDDGPRHFVLLALTDHILTHIRPGHGHYRPFDIERYLGHPVPKHEADNIRRVWAETKRRNGTPEGADMCKSRDS